MIALRRPEHEMRIEIMPMIDVIFLLLTFFVYAMVLMIRAELLPVQMQEFASGQPAKPAPAVTISLRSVTREDPETIIYLAAEEMGDIDRLPTFLSLYDRLAHADLDIKLVGRPSNEE